MGSAAVEYLGVVVVVAMLMAALVAVRPHEASRKLPVNPASAIAKLVVAPVTRPPRRLRAARPRPRPRPRVRPSRPPSVIVQVPRWIEGW